MSRKPRTTGPIDSSSVARPSARRGRVRQIALAQHLSRRLRIHVPGSLPYLLCSHSVNREQPRLIWIFPCRSHYRTVSRFPLIFAIVGSLREFAAELHNVECSSKSMCRCETSEVESESLLSTVQVRRTVNTWIDAFPRTLYSDVVTVVAYTLV